MYPNNKDTLTHSSGTPCVLLKCMYKAVIYKVQNHSAQCKLEINEIIFTVLITYKTTVNLQLLVENKQN